MQTEIEAKFVKLDVDDVRARLEEAGATLEQPMRMMRRQTFDPVEHVANRYVRVRDEGDKVTMTYKQFDDMRLHGAKEIEIVVSDFEDAKSLLENAGLQPKSYQETRRETWTLDGAEIVIDEWPWIKPFIEIEGESEQIVRAVAGKLGFDWNEAVFGDVTQAYRAEFPSLPTDEDFNIRRLPIIKFDMPLPELLKGA